MSQSPEKPNIFKIQNMDTADNDLTLNLDITGIAGNGQGMGFEIE